MQAVDRYADWVTGHTRPLIAVMLVLTLVVGYGATMIPEPAPFDARELISDSEELAAIEYVGDAYVDSDEVSTVSVYVRSDDNVLSKASLLESLRFQQALYADPTVTEPLVTDRVPIVGVENVVATAAMGVTESTLAAQVEGVPLADQIATLEAMSDAEVATVVGTVTSGRPDAPAGGQALSLLPVDADPGTTSVTARAILVSRDIGDVELGQEFPQPVFDGELAMDDLAAQQTGDEYFVATFTVLLEEDAVAQNDTLTLVGPLALVLIVLALAIAYRDLLDIALGLVGVVVVLVWTFGLMGWVGIPSEDFITIVVPVLLIGLSIDYAIHTFMRHREERAAGEDADGSSRSAMRRSLAGVGLALVWVTVTAGIGFLANLTSSYYVLRDFGVVTTLGLVSALLVYTSLVPALKVELDGVFGRFARGDGTGKRAFGTGGGPVSRVLSAGTVAARRGPALVLAVALVTTGVGVYGGLQLEPSLDESGLAEEPPAWMYDLPEPFKPGEYTALEKQTFVDENFARGDETKTFVLLQGGVTDDDAFVRLAAGEAAAADAGTVLRTGDGRPAVLSPLTLLRDVAAVDPDTADLVAANDGDGDGVPDRNVAALYDRLFVVAPDLAERVVERTPDGEYRSLLVVLDTVGSADYYDATDDTRDVAAAMGGDGVTATPTGERVIVSMTLDALTDNVVTTLLVTLGAVIVLLTVGYRATGGSATLGVVTLLPVAFGLSWFFGTLWLVGIKLDLLTSVIASLTIGLGVDYSIHISERYQQELSRQPTVWAAMDATLQGTGGALVGGFATTVAAFGTLALATVPQLQQFGVLIAVALVYAFGGALLLLPSLLVLWTRLFGPADADFGVPGEPATPTVAGADD